MSSSSIVKLEVEPSSRGNALMQAFYDNDGFLDSDDEEEVEVPQKAFLEVLKLD